MGNVIQVSVLIPIYNHSVIYVRRALDSLYAQTLKNAEFILINNGATREAVELINEFKNKDSRFTSIDFHENQGYGKAMNAGLDAAKGEYIGILESDDFIEHVMYASLCKIAFETGADIIKSRFSFYKEADNSYAEGITFPEDKYGRPLSSLEITELPLRRACQWSAIYRKSFLLANDVRWSTLPGASHQDMGFMMKSWMRASLIYITSDVFYFYRIDNANSSTYQKGFVAWGSHKEYEILFEWMKIHKHMLLPEFWNIATRREFVNKWHFLTNQPPHNRFKYFFTALHLVFKKHLRNKNVDFSLFTEEERKLYMQIALRPYQFYWEYFIYPRLLQITKKEGKKTIRFLGVPVYKRVKANGKTKRYIFKCKIFSGKTKEELSDILGKYSAELSHMRRHLEINTKKLANDIEHVKCTIHAQHIHPKTFSNLRGCNSGKDVVLVATGPSAKGYQPIAGAVHVGVNGACRFEHIRLDYLFMQDNTAIQPGNESLTREVLEYNPETCKKFLAVLSQQLVKANIAARNILYPLPPHAYYRENAFPYILSQYTGIIPTNLAIEPIANMAGTVFSAMQFILYTQPKRVFLVGCDCTNGYAYNLGQNSYCGNLKAQIKSWENLKKDIDIFYPNIEIISINPVGLKGLFKDI